MDTYFEDTGTYYANQAMIDNGLTLSMNSRIVYDIGNAEDVKTIKKTTDEFYAIAKEDIKTDGACFYGSASIFTDNSDGGNSKLIWEY